MKNLKSIPAVLLIAAVAFVATGVRAADTNSVAIAKPKPDLLKTCPVSGDKLGGDMGKPFIFTYKDQEVKLCCSSCKADFDKDPTKYLKKIRAADKSKDKP